MDANKETQDRESYARDCAEVTFGLILTILLAITLGYLANRMPGSSAAEERAHERFVEQLIERDDPSVPVPRGTPSYQTSR